MAEIKQQTSALCGLDQQVLAGLSARREFPAGTHLHGGKLRRPYRIALLERGPTIVASTILPVG